MYVTGELSSALCNGQSNDGKWFSELLQQNKRATGPLAEILKQSQGLIKYSHGTVFGETEFFLRHKRYFGTIVASQSAVLHKLSWDNFDKMQREEPTVACAFHVALMRWTSRWVAADLNRGNQGDRH